MIDSNEIYKLRVGQLLYRAYFDSELGEFIVNSYKIKEIHIRENNNYEVLVEGSQYASSTKYLNINEESALADLFHILKEEISELEEKLKSREECCKKILAKTSKNCN